MLIIGHFVESCGKKDAHAYATAGHLGQAWRTTGVALAVSCIDEHYFVSVPSAPNEIQFNNIVWSCFYFIIIRCQQVICCNSIPARPVFLMYGYWSRLHINSYKASATFICWTPFVYAFASVRNVLLTHLFFLRILILIKMDSKCKLFAISGVINIRFRRPSSYKANNDWKP